MTKTKTLTLEETLSKLAPIKADLEAKYNGGNQWTKNAVKRDLDLVNAKIQALQQHNQNLIAQKQEAKEFRGGGYLPKADDGIKINPFTGEPEVVNNPAPNDYNRFMPQLAYNKQVSKQEESKPFDFPTHMQSSMNTDYNSVPIQKTNTTNDYKTSGWDKTKDAFRNANYGEIATVGSQLAPTLNNLYRGFQKPDTYAEIHNPENAYARKLYQESINRNIDARLAGNQQSAVGLQNISKTASQGNAGAYMGMNFAIQKQKQAQDANAYEWKENSEAQAKAQAAQGIHQIGSGIQGEKIRKQMLDSQAKAAQMAYQSQGFNDLAKFGQTQQQMGNQKDRDVMLIDMMNQAYPAFTGYYTQEERGKLQKTLTDYKARERFTKLHEDVKNGKPGSQQELKAFNKEYNIKD